MLYYYICERNRDKEEDSYLAMTNKTAHDYTVVKADEQLRPTTNNPRKIISDLKMKTGFFLSLIPVDCHCQFFLLLDSLKLAIQAEPMTSSPINRRNQINSIRDLVSEGLRQWPKAGAGKRATSPMGIRESIPPRLPHE